MKNYVPIWLSAGLLLSGPCVLSHAQTLARADNVALQNSPNAGQYRSLRTVLQTLRTQYHINILFENRTVDNLLIPADKPIPEGSAQTVLETVLRPFGLTYKRMKAGSFIVVNASKENKSGTDLSTSLPTIPQPSTPEQAIRPSITLQARTIRGRITDAGNSQPLPGVSVVVKGSQRGTTTDANGAYQLETPDDAGTVLVFSYIGFETQEVLVGNQTTINLTLKASDQTLNEVVVVGYGTQRRADVTSAVATVKAENFVKGATRDAGQLLQGKVAGLSVSTPSGDPTAGAQILLRGIPSISNNNGPLILIDGIQGDLRTVAPEDIQSIDVLKDGSAAAIYGTRATGGVILITTKKPANKGTTLDYSGYISTDRVRRMLRVLTADEFRQHIASGDLDKSSDYGASTDWQKAAMQTPVSNVHNLTLRSGNGTTNFLANLNYRDFNGIYQKSNNRAIIGRIEINHSMLNNRLKLNLNMNTNSQKFIETGDGYSFNGYVFRSTIIANPTMPVINPKTGHYASILDYGVPFSIFDNPVARLQESDGLTEIRRFRTYGNISYEPIDGLLLNARLSSESWNETRGYAESFYHPSSLGGGRRGFASRGTTQFTDRTMELTAQYQKTIAASHNISGLLGYSYIDNVRQDYWENNFNFPTDQFSYNNIGLGQALTDGRAGMYSNKTSSNLISFFGRVNYNYQEKYLFQASLRYEGSSRFIGSDKPWGAFPAVSAGWRISRESFMANNKLVNDLKLRVGFGITGTYPDALYQSLYRLQYTGTNNTIYSNGQYLQLIQAASNPNPQFTWEKKAETNIGLDFALLSSRLTGSIDLYNRRTYDLLYAFGVPVPPNTYQTTLANVGTMNNRGLELQLNGAIMQGKNFGWDATLNYSTNVNKLVALGTAQFPITQTFFYPDERATGEPIQAPTHRVEVGQPIGNIWGWKVVDITSAGKWVYERKNAQTGEVTTVESKDAKAEDRQVLGNGLPKFYINFNHNFRYKRFDLGITMRGAFKYQIVNFQRMFYENPVDITLNKLASAYDRVFDKAVLNDARAMNSYYVENGDFWKIDNITFGYNLPGGKIKGLRSARIYVSTLNTFVFTGYKGMDPEVDRGGLQPGNDYRDKYPSVRTFTAGLNLSF